MTPDRPSATPSSRAGVSRSWATNTGASSTGKSDDGVLAETAVLLYGTAILAEGSELKDPAAFAKLLADRLGRTL